VARRKKSLEMFSYLKYDMTIEYIYAQNERRERENEKEDLKNSNGYENSIRQNVFAYLITYFMLFLSRKKTLTKIFFLILKFSLLHFCFFFKRKR
jgi:hypothetical protein